MPPWHGATPTQHVESSTPRSAAILLIHSFGDATDDKIRGLTLGGGIYELYQQRLQAAGISDVVVSPNACIAQHAYGCVVMIYPDGIWYRIREMAEAEKVLEQHIIGGKPGRELIHRTVNPPTGKGVQPPPARQPVAS